jgi:hypothetical protein
MYLRYVFFLDQEQNDDTVKNDQDRLGHPGPDEPGPELGGVAFIYPGPTELLGNTLD